MDASLAIKLILKGESMRAQAHQLFEDALAAGATLIAPALFESELDSIVQRRVVESRMSSADAARAYAGIDDLDVVITSHPDLRRRARAIAAQFNQPKVYDSTYAALAELRGCEFWTADHAFYRAVKDKLSFVKYLADYPLP